MKRVNEIVNVFFFCRRIVAVNTIAAQLLKNFPTFMKPKGSLRYSKEPFTRPYPEPDQCSQYHPILSP
jgi:hypothetical protein